MIEPRSVSRLVVLLATCMCSTSAVAQDAPPRARDLGVPYDGDPGPLNAITDVEGVEVGFTTLIEGEPRDPDGTGPIRTGVTAIFPRGKASNDPVFGAWFTLNGNGEMTGTTWLKESGFLEGPVMITNTHSVGVVRDAVIRWYADRGDLELDFALPVVAETYDVLNDINGQHVTAQHALDAMDAAAPGPVAEGNVGGGVGMICHWFKGGTGTASRVMENGYTVGVLVQCNYGSKPRFSVAGVPVGREIADPVICWAPPEGHEGDSPFGVPHCGSDGASPDEDRGSIIIVVATDAPLLPHQLDRVVKRASLGVGRMGGTGGNSSGDIFIAFSTANPGAANPEENVELEMLPNERINPIFAATIEATEEAILNAMVAAESMTGAYYLHVKALPHDELRDVLRKYGRLEE
jgi:L-aminopeptidase/D-esterase-like protein